MGVPKYRSTLMKNSPEFFYKLQRGNSVKSESLYVDFNPVIHEMAGKVFRYSSRLNVQEMTDEEPTEELVFQKCWEYMFELLTTFNPQNTFYIAIDGVAPLAKQNQQRQRRYLSAKNAQDTNGFNPACISVGTRFMFDLCEYLRFKITKYLEEYPDEHQCEIILSSDQIPGEGEHKIMEHIRREKEGIEDDIYIYGPDGDLLFLTLLSQKNVKLLTGDEMNFHIVNIESLRNYIGSRLSPHWNGASAEYKTLLMRDYVLIGNLLGNDFLPKIKMFYHVEDGWNLLLETYRKNFGATGELTISQITEEGPREIIGDFLKDFFRELAKKEVEFLALQADISYEKIEEKDDPREDNLLKSFAFVCDGSKGFYYKGYREAYYSKELGEKFKEEDVKKMCQSYLNTLYWSFVYYDNGPANWTITFDFCESPFLSDIVQEEFVFELEESEIPESFTPIAQLITILPYSAKNLVPKKYHPLYDPKNKSYLGKDFWVEKFEYDLSGKIESHTGVVRMQPCDRDRVIKALKKFEEKPSKKSPNIWSCIPPDNAFRYKNKFGSVNVYNISFC